MNAFWSNKTRLHTSQNRLTSKQWSTLLSTYSSSSFHSSTASAMPPPPSIKPVCSPLYDEPKCNLNANIRSTRTGSTTWALKLMKKLRIEKCKMILWKMAFLGSPFPWSLSSLQGTWVWINRRDGVFFTILRRLSRIRLPSRLFCGSMEVKNFELFTWS